MLLLQVAFDSSLLPVFGWGRAKLEMVCNNAQAVIFELSSAPVESRVKRHGCVAVKDSSDFFWLETSDNLFLLLSDPQADLALGVVAC